MATRALEGTWEELVTRHAKELAGHKVRVLVLDQPAEKGTEDPHLEESERLLDELAQVGKDAPVHPQETYSRETIYATNPNDAPHPSALEVIASLRGHRLFQTPEDVDRYLQEGRDAWDRGRFLPSVSSTPIRRP